MGYIVFRINTILRGDKGVFIRGNFYYVHYGVGACLFKGEHHNFLFLFTFLKIIFPPNLHKRLQTPKY